MVLLKKLPKSWFDEIFFFGEREFLVFPHCAVHSVEKQEILSHWKNISWNQLFSKFFSKTVVFTKFLSKMSKSKFP